MGRDKALIEFGGRPLVQVLADRLAPLFDEVFLVGRENRPYEHLRVPFVRDRRPGEGPLAGLEALFQHCPGRTVFLCSCDLPHLDPRVVKSLAARRTKETWAVVPLSEHGPEPLHAFYEPRCRSTLEDYLARGHRSARGFLERIPVRHVPWQDLARTTAPFFNLNTPSDLVG